MMLKVLTKNKVFKIELKTLFFLSFKSFEFLIHFLDFQLTKLFTLRNFSPYEVLTK